MKYILMFAAFISGSTMPLQGVVNSRLGQYLGHPLYATFISFAGGLVAVVLVIIASGIGLPPAAGFSGINWIYYSGGLYGVLLVTAVIIATPVIGTANTLVMIVAGQLIMSLVFDHFGLMGLNVTKIGAGRAIGLLLLLAGAYLVQR